MVPRYLEFTKISVRQLLGLENSRLGVGEQQAWGWRTVPSLEIGLQRAKEGDKKTRTVPNGTKLSCLLVFAPVSYFLEFMPVSRQ